MPLEVGGLEVRMNAAVRVSAATAALFLASVGGAGAAVAQTGDCDDAGAGYAPGGVCSIEVDVDALCPEGKPTLAYEVSTEGSASTVNITWLLSSGADVALADQPLTGSLAWPASNPTQVQVRFDVENISAVTTVAAPECVTPGGGVGGSGAGKTPTAAGPALAETGSDVAPLLAAAGGLVVAGAVAVAAARGRRTDTVG